MESSLEHIDIRTLLPQQDPFVLVDKLLSLDEKVVWSSFEVKADHMLVNQGKLLVAGIMENMAQTAAARMGYINMYIEQSNVKLGFIGEIKKLEVQRQPKVGEILTTRVEIKTEILSTRLVAAETRVGEELVAFSVFKIFMSS